MKRLWIAPVIVGIAILVGCGSANTATAPPTLGPAYATWVPATAMDGPPPTEDPASASARMAAAASDDAQAQASLKASQSEAAQASAAADAQASARAALLISMDEFTRIHEGMTLAQVRAIIGSPGTLEVQSANDAIYTWPGNRGGGSNASMQFQGGVLIVKAQYGL